MHAKTAQLARRVAAALLLAVTHAVSAAPAIRGDAADALAFVPIDADGAIIIRDGTHLAQTPAGQHAINALRADPTFATSREAWQQLASKIGFTEDETAKQLAGKRVLLVWRNDAWCLLTLVEQPTADRVRQRLGLQLRTNRHGQPVHEVEQGRFKVIIGDAATHAWLRLGVTARNPQRFYDAILIAPANAVRLIDDLTKRLSTTSSDPSLAQHPLARSALQLPPTPSTRADLILAGPRPLDLLGLTDPLGRQSAPQPNDATNNDQQPAQRTFAVATVNGPNVNIRTYASTPQHRSHTTDDHTTQPPDNTVPQLTSDAILTLMTSGSPDSGITSVITQIIAQSTGADPSRVLINIDRNGNAVAAAHISTPADAVSNLDRTIGSFAQRDAITRLAGAFPRSVRVITLNETPADAPQAPHPIKLPEAFNSIAWVAATDTTQPQAAGWVILGTNAESVQNASARLTPPNHTATITANARTHAHATQPQRTIISMGSADPPAIARWLADSRLNTFADQLAPLRIVQRVQWASWHEPGQQHTDHHHRIVESATLRFVEITDDTPQADEPDDAAEATTPAR